MRRFATACGPVLLGVLLFCALPDGAKSGSDTEALVAKTVAAYGGAEALSRVVAVRETGRVGSTMRGVEGDLLRLYRHPGELRVEIAYPRIPLEVRILSGRRGWRQGRSVTGPPFDAMVLQAGRLALPRNLLEAGPAVRDLGTVEREGKRLRVLSFPLAEGMSLRVEIDPDSGRILRSIGSGDQGFSGTTGGIEFVTEYEDFRTVGGTLFSFREKNFAMGHHTGDTVLTRIEILPEAPEGSFRP